jgi:hypothetical protein
MIRQYLRTAILSVVIITTGIGIPVIYHSNEQQKENKENKLQ